MLSKYIGIASLIFLTSCTTTIIHPKIQSHTDLVIQLKGMNPKDYWRWFDNLCDNTYTGDCPDQLSTDTYYEKL
jgi:hypothetical protein